MHDEGEGEKGRGRPAITVHQSTSPLRVFLPLASVPCVVQNFKPFPMVCSAWRAA